jgi:Tfp pilus assembly protein PilZ
VSREKPHAAHRHILALTIRDKAALYAAYMPFLSNGGIFVPTSAPYKLGEEVVMLLTLMDSGEKTPINGRVAWITPPQSQGNRPPGIGVQFGRSDAARNLKNKIELHLGNALKSVRQTHTM